MLSSRFAGILYLLVVSIVFLPALVLAQLPSEIVPCGGVDCNICHLATLAQNVLNTGIYIAIFLSAVLFAYAGWKYVTAGGNTGKAGDAKKIFTNVLIGLIIILAGWLIVDTIMKELVSTDTGFGPWNQICSPGGERAIQSGTGTSGTFTY